jgi:Ni/Co efflux regulator RcnB
LKHKTFIAVVVAACFAIPGQRAYADKHDKDHDDHQDNGHWRDKHRDHGDHDDDDDRRGYGFAEHDRDEIRGWYASNHRHLPPGLAKKDRLPPGLERQLVVRGAFTPEMQRDMYPVPVDLERRLPPPPPDCDRVVVGAHIVLRNRSSNVIVDVFHLE